MNDSDAGWVLEVLRKLHSADAELLRDLLGCLARVREIPDLDAFLHSKGLSGAAAEPTELVRRRTAHYLRLREAWSQVKELEPCLRQCQLLRETCSLDVGSDLLTDPIAEEPVPLTLEKAREYGHRALEIAELMGDKAEIAELCLVLANHYKLCTEYDNALEYCSRTFSIGKEIGSLPFQFRACNQRYELLTLKEAPVEQLIQCEKEIIAAVEKQGNTNFLLSARCILAKLLVLADDAEAAEELERINSLLQKVPARNEMTVSGQYYYNNFRSLLSYKQGNIEAAISSQKKATLINARNPHYREDFLWNDLAWLETLCRRAGREDEFKGFCHELKGVSKLEQWYLIKGKPEDVEWDEEVDFDGFPTGWEWIDFLGKGSYSLDKGFVITPVMGTGVYVNVYIARLMKEIEGDFVLETVIDYSNDLTRAGGILVYQDDNTLLRFGAGIQADGEVTLTIKSLEQGFFVVARGLLETENLYLRLERNGDCFRGWCGDGIEWYKCGQAEVKMEEKIEAGLFAECTYRIFELVRCKAEKVQFRAVRVKRTA